MTKFQKELMEFADRINEYDFLTYEIAITRRNGNYCVDKFYKNGSFHGAMFIGDFKETKLFLTGLTKSFFYMKPF